MIVRHASMAITVMVVVAAVVAGRAMVVVVITAAAMVVAAAQAVVPEVVQATVAVSPLTRRVTTLVVVRAPIPGARTAMVADTLTAAAQAVVAVMATVVPAL